MKETWKSEGLLINLYQLPDWVSSHAQHPTVVTHPENPDLVRVYFASRSRKNQAFALFADVDLETRSVVEVTKSPIIPLAERGTFDERGLMPSCFVPTETGILMYYLGINQDIDLPFRNAVGLAISEDKGRNFTKVCAGPVLDRQPQVPLYASSPWVLGRPGNWEMFFLSGIKWEFDNKRWRSFYHIKTATSTDGLNWLAQERPVLDLLLHECAIARPQVLEMEGNGRKMYFCSRWNNYKIGVAHWEPRLREFKRGELEILDAGSWEDTMQCYPFYFRTTSGKEFLFYNGNNYGRDGIGIATRA